MAGPKLQVLKSCIVGGRGGAVVVFISMENLESFLDCIVVNLIERVRS